MAGLDGVPRGHSEVLIKRKFVPDVLSLSQLFLALVCVSSVRYCRYIKVRIKCYVTIMLVRVQVTWCDFGVA